MLRVCHIVLSLDFGGMENGIINVANRLVEKEVETHILCIRRPGAMAGRLRPEVACFSLDIPEGFSFPAVLRIAHYLHRHGIRLLYTHNRASLVYGGLAKVLCPNRTHIHGEHGNMGTTGRIARRLLARAEIVTTVSPSLIPEVREAYDLPELDVEVLLNGVDTERFRPYPGGDPVERQRGWRKLGLPALAENAGAVVFVAAGRLEPRKNQELAIRAFARLMEKRQDIPESWLLLVGDGADREALDELARNEGVRDRVVFAGFRNDIDAILPLCDVLLLPSAWGEGLPNVALEAAASGLPVVASNIPGNDVAVRDGLTGFLLPLDDVAAWSEAMHRLAADSTPREKMGRAGRKWMEQEFSLDAMAERYYRLYERVQSPKS